MTGCCFKYLLWANKGFLLKSAIALYLLFSSTCVFAQNIENLHIEKVQDEGLTNDYIVCINQDKNGYMWFGTGEGVFRYDGYSFKAFRNLPGDPNTIGNNVIESLYPENNNLWVGTRSGLSCIDINTFTVKNFKGLKFLQIDALRAKNDSVFFLGTNTGLYEFNKNNYQLTWLTAIRKDVTLTSISDDHYGHLYLTSDNGFYCYTIATGVSRFYRPDLPTYPRQDKSVPLQFGRSVIDGDGNLWMGTWDAGLAMFDTKTEQIKSWCHPTDDVSVLPYKIVINLLADEFGNIWLANKEAGLTIFNPSKNKFTNYPVDWESESKISGSVISLFRDRSGIVWIGTENGIYKYDPHRVYLTKTDLLLKTATGLTQTHTQPTALFKDREGIWWMGMYEGIFIYDEKTGILQDQSQVFGLPKHYAVFNILQDAQGTVWATAKNLLVEITKKTNTSFKAEIFKSDDIKSTFIKLYIDNENRIWLGTHSSGIFRFDQDAKKFISYHYNVIGPRTKINEIRAFCELSKDSLLLGGEQTGLILLRPGSGKYQKIDLVKMDDADFNLSVNAIYKKGEDLWIGTDDNGLLHTNTRFKKPVAETISDGLPSMSVSTMIGDKQNNLWLLTNAGVVKFQIPERKITLFDEREGVLNSNGLNAMAIDNNDNVLIGSRGLAYSFNQGGMVKNDKTPVVSITNLRIFDKNYVISKDETIKLDYNQNYFTFEYVALNYTQSRFNRYAYKMTGLDKKWNYAGSRRYVSYANLDEGTYTFSVKGCNNEGVWSNVPATLVLIINPPFWRRWWFYTLIILVIAGIIYALYEYTVSQLKIRLQLRDKIARDLHDDIGSTLSGINIFSKIALQKMQPGQPGIDLIEKISERSQNTLEALSDIVWSINTRNDGMDNFVMKANEYLSELDAQNIAYDFVADDDVTLLKMGMVVRRELYLIFKEAVCNASKYARCNFIQINLSRHKDICTLTVYDNGKGFDVNAVSSGNGIYNMRQRAKKMNADFKIESQENKGTTITLIFRITR